MEIESSHMGSRQERRRALLIAGIISFLAKDTVHRDCARYNLALDKLLSKTTILVVSIPLIPLIEVQVDISYFQNSKPNSVTILVKNIQPIDGPTEGSIG